MNISPFGREGIDDISPHYWGVNAMNDPILSKDIISRLPAYES